MIILGLEGTAHTAGVGIITDKGKVLANVYHTHIPEEGGIHPREAANHHVRYFPELVKKALADAGITPDDIGLVSFSRGPGLGPCLRTVATAARAISGALSIPIVGVNHCVAHLEIGRLTTGSEDPVMLYVSGGNTQVISYSKGRYRVFGETLDIGVGNLLDKVAREMGIPFPGGPVIEKMALEGEKLLPLPYSVKGMDISFSGIYTAITSLLKKGARKEDIAYSLQETVFAMLTEVTERALAHLGKTEVLLAGGVARNEKLRKMVEIMAENRGAKLYVPPANLCVDNGTMIAWLGYLTYSHGGGMKIEDTGVIQRFRTDEVPVTWDIETKEESYNEKMPGAEAVMYKTDYRGRAAITKLRLSKEYRHAELDSHIIRERTKREIKNIMRMKDAGIRTPVIYEVSENSITMERINTESLSKAFPDLEADKKEVMKKIGRTIGMMHEAGITHGDLTTSNILYLNGEIYIIDPSYGKLNSSLEDMGVDLHLLKESIKSRHTGNEGLFKIFSEEYAVQYKDGAEVLEKLHEIEGRRRYV